MTATAYALMLLMRVQLSRADVRGAIEQQRLEERRAWRDAEEQPDCHREADPALPRRGWARW